MIFLNLNLNNIGLYKGENIFNLKPKENKNVILFGGQNGAGKTTILESVKLCLYGKNIYNLTKKEYESLIQKIIHRDEKKGSISLEFLYFTESKQEKYKVVRAWNISKKFKEEFFLYKDNELLKELPKEYWQDFLYDIIPPGLINFFFFDGEKIEKLAEDLSEVEFINDIKNLIGISVIDELYSSLGVIQKKYLKDENLPQSLIKKLEELEVRKENIDKKINKYFQEQSQIKQKLAFVEKNLKAIEKEFYKKGGKLFKDYENLKIRKETLSKELDEIKNEIRILSSKELPLALALDLLEELISQLDTEIKIKQHELEEKLLKEKYQALLKILNDINIPQEKNKEIEKIFSVKNKIDGKIIHNLTENEINEIKVILNSLKNIIIPKAKYLFDSLEKIEDELAKTELALENVPKEEILAPYIKKIKELEEEKTKLILQEKEIIETIKNLEKELKNVERDLKKVSDALSKKYKKEKVLELIEKSQRVLDRFKKEFINKKLHVLKREILEAISKLERKEKFIVDLEINPETFEITLYDRFNKVIPLDRLSAGERQIFAISFLWGLARASGKAIPVIIDTPLGRLDVQHKENIVKNFFPNISHQVIILSTDAEINEELYSLIKDYIAHSYTLEYDNECMCTKIREGYFWDKKSFIGVSNEI